jgi:hypothetical protein
MDKQKIIDKIHKCLRLAESGNPNEAASALRQAHAMMRKYNISEEDVHSRDIREASALSGGYYNPPYWAVALSELIAQAFECRAYISRREEQRPIFRFMGVDYTAGVAAYTFTVLFRQLRRSRRDYMNGLVLEDKTERLRQGNVFAQAWLFRIAKTVAEFAADSNHDEAIEAYVKEQYGEPLDFERDPADTETSDYEVILSGMRAANTARLLHPVTSPEGEKRRSIGACA